MASYVSLEVKLTPVEVFKSSMLRLVLQVTGFAVYQALRLVVAVETAILHVVDIAFTTIHHWIWSVERTLEKT